MDYWKSFELSQKTLQQFVNNLHAVKRTLDDKEKCNLFFNRFPFDQFLNFTMMDGCSVMLCIKILDLFANYEDFCNYDDRFNYALEFILINLSHITTDCKEILPLFKLLSKILRRNIQAMDYSFKNIFDRERILEVMLKMTKFKCIQMSNFMFYSSILTRLMDTNFPDIINSLVVSIFEKFREHNALMEQLVVCKLILNSKLKLLCEPFENIWIWLIEKGPILLTETCDEDLLEDAIYCLITFIANSLYLKSVQKNENSKFWQHVEELYNNLIKVASDICLLTSRLRLKNGCFKLLKFILMKFLNAEKLPSSVQDEILDNLNSLPEDLELWPKSENHVFFCICHICASHSKIIWKHQDVLNALMRCFYNRRHATKTFVLKSIYYLYPILIDNVDIDFYTKILGDDLLNYFANFCSVSYLYSYNSHQLKWMLDRAPKSVKPMVLTEWLNAIENDDCLEEVLISTIQSCKAEMTLLHLMMDNNNLGKTIGLKAASLLRRMPNYEVSSFITLILPFTIEKPTSLYNVLLAEPGISVDSNNSILICSLMGAVIPTLNDTQVLKGACIFSSKLLASKKDDPYAVRGFCRNITNIRHLIDITDKVDDETGVEIIRLLKVVILVQQRNKVKLEYSLKEDFKIFIKGSTDRIGKSLRLLYHVLIYKNSLITLDSQYILSIYKSLLDYSLNSILQAPAYQCIIILLKRMPWLSQTVSSSVHMEMACLSFSDSTFKANVFTMLDVWLRLLRNETHNGFCPIPETAIRSFIMRGNITECKMQEYLTILEDLLKRENHEVKPNVFFSGK